MITALNNHQINVKLWEKILKQAYKGKNVKSATTPDKKTTTKNKKLEHYYNWIKIVQVAGACAINLVSRGRCG